jgi:ferrochelatase
MSRFLTEPPHRHGNPNATAVILVNLGTPDEPTPSAVKRYLREFLSDPRVVEIPKLIWWFILNGIILNIRPKQSAAKYASIWMPEGSPLRVFSERQTKLLKGLLGERGHRLTVNLAMRYGSPSIPSVLNHLKASGVNRMLVVPMYPQYSASTTATVVDEVSQWLQQQRNQPEMRFIRNFHDDDAYLASLEKTVRKHWETHGPLGKNDRLMISFHGLPKRSLDLGDPYFCECHKTGRLLTERLNLKPEQFKITFQSRFGKAQWLQPYTAPTLHQMGKEGISRVDVICPGFVADCLETLEEIAQEARDDFITAGGKEFHYIPALNENGQWIKALADLVERHLAGWNSKAPIDQHAMEISAAQAIKLGARS